MPTQLDESTARLLLNAWGAWFGGPPLEHGGALIDGRIRFREAVAMGLGKAIPKPVVITLASDAAKYLALAGHYDRARQYVPSELTDARDVAAYCHCAIEIVAPLCVKVRYVGARMQARTTPARRRAIERIHRLLLTAEQTTGSVSATDIRKALAQWL